MSSQQAFQRFAELVLDRLTWPPGWRVDVASELWELVVDAGGQRHIVRRPPIGLEPREVFTLAVRYQADANTQPLGILNYFRPDNPEVHLARIRGIVISLATSIAMQQAKLDGKPLAQVQP